MVVTIAQIIDYNKIYSCLHRVQHTLQHGQLLTVKLDASLFVSLQSAVVCVFVSFLALSSLRGPELRAVAGTQGSEVVANVTAEMSG